MRLSPSWRGPIFSVGQVRRRRRGTPIVHRQQTSVAPADTFMRRECIGSPARAMKSSRDFDTQRPKLNITSVYGLLDRGLYPLGASILGRSCQKLNLP